MTICEGCGEYLETELPYTIFYKCHRCIKEDVMNWKEEKEKMAGVQCENCGKYIPYNLPGDVDYTVVACSECIEKRNSYLEKERKEKMDIAKAREVKEYVEQIDLFTQEFEKMGDILENFNIDPESVDKCNITILRKNGGFIERSIDRSHTEVAIEVVRDHFHQCIEYYKSKLESL